jgi:hypothetical protein
MDGDSRSIASSCRCDVPRVGGQEAKDPGVETRLALTKQFLHPSASLRWNLPRCPTILQMTGLSWPSSSRSRLPRGLLALPQLLPAGTRRPQRRQKVGAIQLCCCSLLLAGQGLPDNATFALHAFHRAAARTLDPRTSMKTDSEKIAMCLVWFFRSDNE